MAEDKIDTMNSPTWRYPAIGAFYEWRAGSPMEREVIEVVAVDVDHQLIQVDGSSGTRWVSVSDFYQSSQSPPLHGRHR